MILLSEHSSPPHSVIKGDAGERLSTEKTQEELLLKILHKLYEALRDIPEFLKSEAIVPTVIKVPWQARIVNVINGGEMLSELIKEEGDCVVTDLHKIPQHSQGREIGSADDAAIMLANLNKIGHPENTGPCHYSSE